MKCILYLLIPLTVVCLNRPRSGHFSVYGRKRDEFAYTISELRMQIYEDMISDSPLNNYTQQDLDHIFGAYKNLGALVPFERRASGRPYMTHAIGTASCALRFGLPPIYAAAMMGHGTYIKIWETKQDFWKKNMDVCELRRIVAALTSVEVERVIYLWTMLQGYGGKPPHVMESLLRTLQQDINAFDQELKYLILMNICDEIEEHQNGEQWWSYNHDLNKRRMFKEYSDMINITRLLADDEKAAIVSKAFKSTMLLFSKSFYSDKDEFTPHYVTKSYLNTSAGERMLKGIEMLNAADPDGISLQLFRGTYYTSNSHFDRQRNYVKSKPQLFVSRIMSLKAMFENDCEMKSLSASHLADYADKVEPYSTYVMK